MGIPAEYLILVISFAIVLFLLLLKFLFKKTLTPVNYRKANESITAYLYLLPSFVVLSIFVFWPVIYSFILSFFKWDFQNQANPAFIGLENYKKLFQLKNPIDVSFNQAFFNSLLILLTFIFLMHWIFDIKKIQNKKHKNIVKIMSVLGIAGIILTVFFNVIGIISSLILVIAYTILAAKKFAYNTNDKLMGRLILFFVFIFLTSKIGILDIIKYVSIAKQEADFIKAIWNTTYYVLLSTPITIFLALLIALLMNRKLFGKTFFRTIYFIPFVTSVVAVSLVWQWIFNDNGLLNYFLQQMGFEKVLWLKDEKFTIPTVAIISIWKLIGYYSVIFLSGLQNISRTYYEAAEVDGANPWQKFKFITWPLLSPTTFFILIVSMIGAFKVFSEIFVLYSGMPGPYNNSGLTVVYFIYDKFYTQQRMGEASAAAYVLFGIILLFTFIQIKAGKKRVHYDS
ncbi:sugar ABC transporter permease [Oceanotoga sp. DSM 15011]|jgi:multiple sugar transport system permease protein|uniref:carbohydrate ABC transporter permease n=1 Tax=Oceanotoga sp. DSM 15011 TaxID=2984951 RepID=UPI0021F3EA32|nr:sugar ABC transporter permease [Oceanotoga sp. DSM 15011]UYP00416.1 sugar ABC transporter permease [Oceanotoga sp. DSM 15011]